LIAGRVIRFSTGNNSIKLKRRSKGVNQSSHLRISHKAESVESVLAQIESEVNATDLVAA